MSKNFMLNTEYRLLNTAYAFLTSHALHFTKLGALLLIAILTACHSSKKNVVSESTTPGLKSWTMKYQRGPCFGQCPVYAFYLLSDNTGLMYVHANLLEPGWYAASLDQKAINEILALVEPDAWWHEDMSAEPEISDLPMLNLTYFHRNGLRTMTVKKQFTPSLSNVFEKLDRVVTESHWVPSDIRPLESPEEPQTELIVQLKEGIDIHEWMKKYDRFGIELKKKIAPRLQYYLVKKDPAKGDSNDFLQYIREDSDVLGAEWDKELNQRKP